MTNAASDSASQSGAKIRAMKCAGDAARAVV